MSGIARIKITDPFYEDERAALGIRGQPLADQLYREILRERGMTLCSGVQTLECTREEAKGRYDWSEGIDVILHCQDGSKFTLQEHFLSPNTFQPTVTIELYKASGRKGAWFYCTAQWYFVSYFSSDLQAFESWILFNLAGLRQATAQNRAAFFDQQPTDPTRGGPFRCWRFSSIPPDVVVAMMINRRTKLRSTGTEQLTLAF